MSVPSAATFQPLDFLRFFLGPAAVSMLVLIIAQEASGAVTTLSLIHI